jgi:hypothetical protein
MHENDFVNTGNLARLRTAMRIMQECVFLDSSENKKCEEIIHGIVGLEFHTNGKISISQENDSCIQIEYTYKALCKGDAILPTDYVAREDSFKVIGNTVSVGKRWNKTAYLPMYRKVPKQTGSL